VAKNMADRDEFLADVRYRLEQAQAVQKAHYDKAHRAVSYAVGDWVWLRLRHRAPASLPSVTKGKLKPRFYGPYRISELINNVAVRLALPARARLHDVFHVGLLKKFVGTPPASPPVLPPVHHGAVVPEPDRVTRTHGAWGAPAFGSLEGRASFVCFMGGRRQLRRSLSPLPARGRAARRGGGEMSCGGASTSAAAAAQGASGTTDAAGSGAQGVGQAHASG